MFVAIIYTVLEDLVKLSNTILCFCYAFKALKFFLFKMDMSVSEKLKKVAFIYRSFFVKVIWDPQKPATYTCIEDRLTAVLAFFADG